MLSYTVHARPTPKTHFVGEDYNSVDNANISVGQENINENTGDLNQLVGTESFF